MSFTTSWSIQNLRTLDHVSKGFVTHVVYSIAATDDFAEAEYHGQIEFETPSESFIPFQDLTEAQVIQWVLESLGQEEVERIINLLKTQIDRQLNPPVEPKAVPLPWVGS
jgi:hypothetical protein